MGVDGGNPGTLGARSRYLTQSGGVGSLTLPQKDILAKNWCRGGDGEGRK